MLTLKISGDYFHNKAFFELSFVVVLLEYETAASSTTQQYKGIQTLSYLNTSGPRVVQIFEISLFEWCSDN